jgi:hypothetical protein
MGKGKGKAGKGSAGGGPSTKAAGSSGQGSSRPSAPPCNTAYRPQHGQGCSAGRPSSGRGGRWRRAQTEPEPAGGSTKKEKEKLRKERQRQRKVDEAWEALQGAIEQMGETAGSVEAVEEAMQAAAKHEARCEKLALLVVEARELIEQARAADVERARVAAEEAAAAAVVKAAAKAEEAAERLQAEGELAALTLRVQQVQARLGVTPAPAPHPDAEETMCVVCMEHAAKDRRCGHVCTCACVRRAPSC